MVTFRGLGLCVPALGSAREAFRLSYYRHHVFFCTNEREDGSQSCGQCGAQAMRDYLKRRAKELGIAGKGGVRINTAGCLDRCEEGPVIVVYPEATWYTYVDQEDIDEILSEHLLKGRVVERLLLPEAEMSTMDAQPEPPGAPRP